MDRRLNAIVLMGTLGGLLLGVPVAAHTLSTTAAKRHVASYIERHVSNSQDVRVRSCHRRGRHLVFCHAYWERALTRGTYFCKGTASVRFRSRTSHRTRTSLLSRDCSYP